MKLNELISSFKIYTSNEESTLLEMLTDIKTLDQFNEREQVIINNLVKKSLVNKIRYNGQTMVIKNEY